MGAYKEAIRQYVKKAKKHLLAGGQEEALKIPLSELFKTIGESTDLEIVLHGEYIEKSSRPDFGMHINSALCGHIELKRPGTSIDPATYKENTHNYNQWQNLKELPNLLYTNGTEFRLWRFGEPVGEPANIHIKDLRNAPQVFDYSNNLDALLNNFINWKPVKITSTAKLIEIIAPLARIIKLEVQENLTSDRSAQLRKVNPEQLIFLNLSADWKKLISPGSKDEEFADGFAQTIIFGLLLAVSEGIDLADEPLSEIGFKLEDSQHTLIGRILKYLTDHIRHTSVSPIIDLAIRVLSAVEWSALEKQGEELYLHLYEDFLAEYDQELREKTGSYYTPIPVVDAMTRLTDNVLTDIMGRDAGLRNPNVSIIDPAMGTGTYPLSIIRYVADKANEQYGAGAMQEALNALMQRLYGIEIQSGPFSVAELRISNALSQAGVNIPKKGLNFFVADTLEDPKSGSKEELTFSAQLIANQRIAANKVKRDTNIQVVIGNPPYDDHAGGRGGWIEKGDNPRSRKSHPPIADFKVTGDGNGKHDRHLSNMYSYFWRWATWKAFESTNNPDTPQGDEGVVSFITASGYLTSHGFRGMRKYLREKCSHGWIINLTPEGINSPNNVFDISTPVVIGIFVRTENTSSEDPADIKYIDIHGTREEKHRKLSELNFSDKGWKNVRNAWKAPFTPVPASMWDEYPATSDIFPWKANGIMAGHNWIYATTEETLHQRLNAVIHESDPLKKSELFKESRDTNLEKTKVPLHGNDVEKNTRIPFKDILVYLGDGAIVECGYRFLDRQFLIADSRLISQPSPTLWQGRISGQVFGYELHSEFPRSGPATVYSSLIPDVHFFRGSGGGRSLPKYHPNGELNIAPGLHATLQDLLHSDIAEEDIFDYVAGVTGHSGFVDFFEEELQTPETHVPITKNAQLWGEAVRYGRYIQWLHSFGERGAHPDTINNVLDALSPDQKPRYEKSVGANAPLQSEIRYSPDSKTLKIGSGYWSNISEEVWEYSVGGKMVLRRWLEQRCIAPKKKTNSPLDRIVETSWRPEWTDELAKVMAVLTILVNIEKDMQILLENIMKDKIFTRNELSSNGVIWPNGDKDRKPRRPLNDSEDGTLAF